MVLGGWGIKGERAAHESYNGSDFDDCKHELGFTVAFDPKEVDHHYRDEEDGHKKRAVHVAVPVAYGYGGCYYF